MGGHAFVGLHARTVLLISREALGLFDADEMVAIMAHELGHDYVSDEYAKAREEHDDERLQELELRCDGIAVITLRKMHMDPARLISAATKLLRHNERIRTLDYASHVPLDQRVRFIIAVARLTANSRQHVTPDDLVRGGWWACAGPVARTSFVASSCVVSRPDDHQWLRSPGRGGPKTTGPFHVGGSPVQSQSLLQPYRRTANNQHDG